MWLIASSLLPHNLQLLFCCVLSVLDLLLLSLVVVVVVVALVVTTTTTNTTTGGYVVVPSEFFISELANGLSLEFQWQQISSCFLDSFQYSRRFQQCRVQYGPALLPISNFFSPIFNPLRIVPSVFFCCILTFDPAKHAIPKWWTRRKWHILMAVMGRNRVGGLGWQYRTS